MAKIERIGNLGYAALAPEVVPGTAITPADFTLLMDETMTTSYNLQDQAPAYGSKAETYAVIPGQRDHKGDITIIAEPNTATLLADALLTRGSVSGSGPYTWPFSHTGNSKTYTLDVSLANVVKRFVGFQVSKLAPVWNKNELQFKASGSALASFQGAYLSSVPSGTGPYVVTIDSTYGTDLTKVLVAGDLIRFYHATDGSTIDATVTAITDATHFTTSTNVTTLIVGDAVHLRPATVALNNLQTFLWSNTQFCFGATAAAAASAVQTRVETGSTWELTHNFESDSGSMRSGGADPASLIRTTVNSAVTIKKFFDTPEDVLQFNQQSKQALVIHHYAGTNNMYDFQIIFNNIKTDDPLPKIKPKTVNYSNIKYHPQNDNTDGQMFGLVVKSGLATIA
jgi:hypothetical protein